MMPMAKVLTVSSLRSSVFRLLRATGYGLRATGYRLDCRAMPQRALKVALLGFGTVGASVARILVERPELAGRLQLTHIFNRDVARKRAPWMPSSITWTDDYAQVLASEPDIVVEVVGGVNPAREWVSRAIERGSSVVTANKMLLAAHGPELLRAAAVRGVELRFEAAVATVRFQRPWEIYFAGDNAAFPLAVAHRLVRAGIGTWPSGHGG